jgi:PBP1b-binding outer membrane lipoprotein LpoB
MKKHFIQIIAIFGMFFFNGCSDSGTKESTRENNIEHQSETKSTKVQTVDSVKKTSISIGPDGAGVKSKNTDVQVNRTGVNVGTKDVKVDIKTRK